MANSWFLSSHVDASFFDLLEATSAEDCSQYDNDCSDFHDVDVESATEYVHNEL